MPTKSLTVQSGRSLLWDLSKSSERRQATVLFVDVVDFTAYTSRAGAEQAYALMQCLFNLLNTEVQEQGCVVKSSTGDGIAAFFGVPEALEDAPLRACRAALRIKQRLAREAAEIEARHGVQPQLRMSINSGLVVFGQVAEGEPSSITAYGDAVNLGSRLMSAAEPDTIVMSSETAGLVDGFVYVEEVGPFTFKGKAEPQHAYRLVALREGATRFAAAKLRELTPLVGREAELKKLCVSFNSMDSVKVIDIVGEAGIGKSRLIHEFKQRLQEQNVVVLKGDCTANSKDISLFPLLGALRSGLRMRASEDEEVTNLKIEENLTRLDLNTPVNCALLAQFLGFGVHGALDGLDDTINGLDDTIIGLRTRDLLVELLERLCRQSRTLLILEDIHWIDNASEQLISRVVVNESAFPLLIVHTRRPEYLPPWGNQQGYEQLQLGPLSDDDTLSIVCSVLRSAKLTKSLAHFITQKAEGNPLFAEELARFLPEQAAIRDTLAMPTYAATRLADALPGNLQLLISARVDRLPIIHRSLLQVASVIGREFNLSLLAEVAGETEDDVARLLEPMEEAGLIHNDIYREYTFKHALVHKAVYDSLLSYRARKSAPKGRTNARTAQRLAL